MKARIVSMAALLVIGVLSAQAQAQEAGDSNRLQHLMARFHKADVNGDGQLTREEAKNGMPRVYQHFSEIDTENKGYVTLAQIASFIEAHPRLRDTSPPSGSPPPSSAHEPPPPGGQTAPPQ